jgi:hypothetical protein
MSHISDLEIKRAEKGIVELQTRINELEALEKTFVPRVGLLRTHEFMPLKLRISATLDEYFESSDERQRFKSAELQMALVKSPTTDLNKEYEDKFARAKDGLEDAIRSLQERVAALKGQTLTARDEVVPPAGGSHPPEQTDSPIIWKFTWMGFGVDLEKLWKKIKKLRHGATPS